MYTLTTNNNIIRDSDGAIIPLDPRNSDYISAVTFLLGENLVTVDSNNRILTTTPDGSDLHEVVIPDLATLRIAAKALIDDAAGRARGRYITVAPGQDATYIAKAMDADKFKAANYLPADASGFPWIQAEVAANGGSLTVHQATDGIIAQRDQWYQLGTAIEAIRIGGKLDIDTRIKDTTIAASRDATIAQLNSI